MIQEQDWQVVTGKEDKRVVEFELQSETAKQVSVVAPPVAKTDEDVAEAIAADTEDMAAESDLLFETAVVGPGLENPEFGVSAAHIVAQALMVGFVDLDAKVDAVGNMCLIGSTNRDLVAQVLADAWEAMQMPE